MPALSVLNTSSQHNTQQDTPLKTMVCPKLETERLRLEPLDISFASEKYVNWMNDPEVNRYLESGNGYTLEQLSQYLEEVEKKSILFWAIVTKDQGKHIGNVKIDPINWRHKFAEYGTLMGDKSEWRKGYSYESSRAVLDFCFSVEVGLRKVNLGVVENNAGAVKLYKKLGFEVEGKLKKHVYHDDRWCNVLRMAVFNPGISIDE